MVAEMPNDDDLSVGFLDGVDYTAREERCVRDHLAELGRSDVSFIGTGDYSLIENTDIRFLVTDHRQEDSTNVLRITVSSTTDTGIAASDPTPNDYKYKVLGMADHFNENSIVRADRSIYSDIVRLRPRALESGADYTKQSFSIYEIQCQ
ncbi:MAG: hypothetical protein AAFQ79_09115 [Pseudomonadota bacterium]